MRVCIFEVELYNVSFLLRAIHGVEYVVNQVRRYFIAVSSSPLYHYIRMNEGNVFNDKLNIFYLLLYD